MRYAWILLAIPTALGAQGVTRNIPLLAAQCQACHSPALSGSSAMPAIHGMRESHLLAKLSAYASAELPTSVMVHHAKGWTKEELSLLAAYFAEQVTAQADTVDNNK